MAQQIDAVQRMQNYIEKYFADNITLADLAYVSGYSPWYSARIFKQYTGLSPADYIRRLRLSKSAIKLRDEKTKIADVAFELGFSSVDGYQRAFHRYFKCNPKEYANNPCQIPLFTTYGVKFKEMWGKKNYMEKLNNIFIQVIDKPVRKVIIKRGITAKEYWTYCEEVGCDIWGILKSMKSLCGEPVCLWLNEKYRTEGTSEYVQGVEVDTNYNGAVPDGFDVIELPASKYLMFQGEPFDEEEYCAAIDSVQNAIKKYPPSVIGFRYDNNNPKIQLEPIGNRGYIELVPITNI